MKPPKEEPPVCDDFHASRFMPIPETTAEEVVVQAAQSWWDSVFWTPDADDPSDGRASCWDIPRCVLALMPGSDLGLVPIPDPIPFDWRASW